MRTNQKNNIIFLQLLDSFFFLLNNPKNLDLSYKMDLDLWDCFGRVKFVFEPNFIGLILLFVVSLKRENPSYSQINTVPMSCFASHR